MTSRLTKRPVPIPADVLEQLKECAAQSDYPQEFTETTYLPAPEPQPKTKHDWLLEMIERGHR